MKGKIECYTERRSGDQVRGRESWSRGRTDGDDNEDVLAKDITRQNQPRSSGISVPKEILSPLVSSPVCTSCLFGKIA